MTVFLIRDAEDDLSELARHIARADSPRRAAEIIKTIRQACLSLATFPERGHLPPELEGLSITDYRQIDSPPWRIIYEIEGGNVFIHAILDSRRDLQDLLQQRLLR